MQLLYIDDSGSVVDKNCTQCVLAGFAIHEGKTHWIEKAVDDIVSSYFPNFPDIELHGNHMRTGKKEWRRIEKSIREKLIIDILTLIKNSYPKIRLFASVISKKSAIGIDISENLFTQIASRFDMYLKRIYRTHSLRERGIAIFDKSINELKIQAWSHAFKKEGHKYGKKLYNFAEVPLFLDSKMSRLIQIADIIAYAIFRRYEFNDDTFFTIIKDCFDKEGGVVHGLHITQ
jgi:hypothetical protein